MNLDYCLVLNTTIITSVCCTVIRYQDYGGGYGGGYGNQGYGGGAGNFQLGAKRKSDYSDFGGSPKKPFGGSGRGKDSCTKASCRWGRGVYSRTQHSLLYTVKLLLMTTPILRPLL